MPTPYTWTASKFSDMNVDSITKALLNGKNWATANLTYSFPGMTSVWSTNTTTGYGPPDKSHPPGSTSNEPWTSGYSALTDNQQKAVANAFNAWAAVTNLSFTKVNDNGSVVGDMRLAFASGDLHPSAQAWVADFPDNTAFAGDVWFSSTSTSKETNWWSPGTYEFVAAMHEIGHALGLKHSFNDSTQVNNTKTLPAYLDSRSYTIMSYAAFGGQSGSYFSYEPTTPMVIDLMAMQHLYGADMKHNSGNNIYKFSAGSNYNKTIWDAGGLDTIEYVGTNSSVIDLREGYSGSRMGKALNVYDENGSLLRSSVDNVFLAFGTVIERANGGNGNDVMFGNDIANVLTGNGGNDSLAGGKGQDILSGGNNDDSLSGGLGKDTLTGGSGKDNFFFNTAPSSWNTDTIKDFTPGLDKIKLENAIFSGLVKGAMSSANFVANAAGKAMDSKDFIIYETDTGKLYYDADGSGHGAAISFAIVGTSTHPVLKAADFVIV